MNADPSEFLQQAVTLARGGDRPKACQVLRELVKTKPRYEQAWLWLSDFSDDPKEQISALRKALAINPGNAFARARLAQLQGQLPSSSRAAAINPVMRARSQQDYLHARAALKKGQKQTALDILLGIVNQDQSHVDTRILLSELVPDIDDQITGLENALALMKDVNHESSPGGRRSLSDRRRYQRARSRLETLRRIRADPLATGEMYELNGQLRAFWVIQIPPALDILIYQADYYRVGYWAHLGGFFAAVFIPFFLRPEAILRYLNEVPV